MYKRFLLSAIFLWLFLLILSVLMLRDDKRKQDQHHEETAKMLVNQAYNIVSRFERLVRRHTMTKSKAQDIAHQILTQMSHQSQHYVFVASMSPRFRYIVHGYASKGMDSSMPSSGGSRIFSGEKMFQMVKRMGGKGFVQGPWLNTQTQRSQHGMSYLTQTPDWKWLIGSEYRTLSWLEFLLKQRLGFCLLMVGFAGLMTWLLWWLYRGLIQDLGERPEQLGFRIQELGKGLLNQSMHVSPLPKSPLLGVLEQAQENLSLRIEDIKRHHEGMRLPTEYAYQQLKSIQNFIEKVMNQSSCLSKDYQESTLWLSRLCEQVKDISVLDYEEQVPVSQSLKHQLEQMQQYTLSRQKHMHRLQQAIQELKESIEQSNMLMMHVHIEQIREVQTEEPQEETTLEVLRHQQEQHLRSIQFIFEQVRHLNTSESPLIQQGQNLKELARHNEELFRQLRETLAQYVGYQQDVRTTLHYIEQNLILFQQKHDWNRQQKEMSLNILHDLKQEVQDLTQNVLEIQHHVSHTRSVLLGFSCLDRSSYSVGQPEDG